MYRLVQGSTYASLVNCILQPLGNETRIYVAEVSDELVKRVAHQTTWRVAQIYLKIDHVAGFSIQATGLRAPLSAMILEVDSCHYTLWSREGEERKGSQLPFPYVEICLIPVSNTNSSNDSQTVYSLMSPLLKL